MRLAIGWSQCDLGKRANASQPTRSRVEAGQNDRADLVTIARLLDALQVRAEIKLEAPSVRIDGGSATAPTLSCVAFLARRLATSGWLVEREVEIRTQRSHGWIDVLAYRPGDSALLVIEMKTEIEDLGRIERSVGWYLREALGPRGSLVGIHVCPPAH